MLAKTESGDQSLQHSTNIELNTQLAVSKVAPVSRSKFRLPTSLPKAVFTSLFIFLSFYFVQNVYQNQNSLDIQKLETQTTQAQVLGTEAPTSGAGFPIRLRIPKINVDTAIEFVNLTQDGAMEVPSNTQDVGWFALGPQPGEKGSAVIAGHYNGEYGQNGVFAELSELKAGDEVQIEDGNGSLLTFIVRESRIYDPGFAENVFSGSDATQLNLVTCDGVWDVNTSTYSKRLVVFTDLAG